MLPMGRDARRPTAPWASTKIKDEQRASDARGAKLLVVEECVETRRGNRSGLSPDLSRGKPSEPEAVSGACTTFSGGATCRLSAAGFSRRSLQRESRARVPEKSQSV